MPLVLVTSGANHLAVLLTICIIVSSVYSVYFFLLVGSLCWSALVSEVPARVTCLMNNFYILILGTLIL